MDKHSEIMNNNGRKVSSFTLVYESLSKAPIVDAAVASDFPCSGETYLQIVRNALRVPAIDYNLISPFSVREAEVVVKYFPKIQHQNPEEEWVIQFIIKMRTLARL